MGNLAINKQSNNSQTVDEQLDCYGLLDRASFGFAVINVSGELVSANASFLHLLGFNDDKLPSDQCLESLMQDHYRGIEVTLKKALSSAAPSQLYLGKENSDRQLVIHLDALEKGFRSVSLHTVSVGLAAGNKEFKRTEIDPLTGLGNRALFNKIIAEWKPEQEDENLILIMIDLDRFKQVNDTLGHECGDLLLKLVAKRLKSTVRQQDTLVRLGGDEFVILQTAGTNPGDAAVIGKRIVELLNRPFLIDKRQVNIGASVGISALNHGSNETNELYRHADLALYAAKSSGANSVKVFERELEQQAQARREMEIDLRRALVLNEFVLYYQPEVCMESKKITGFEALVRWNNSKRGLVPPLDFIPIAEQIGFIHNIGEWVLKTACQQAMTWPNDMEVAVNVSPAQLEGNEFVAIVKQALEESGLDPCRLEIEITESVLMSEQDQAIKRLWQLHKMGVRIAIDDFGTGYSSLSLLNSFPFSKIKIDKSFIHEMSQDKARTLVDSIISIGKSLGITTLAEGIETEEQYTTLMAGGCFEAQGYLIHRPMPKEDIESYIQNSGLQSVE